MLGHTRLRVEGKTARASRTTARSVATVAAVLATLLLAPSLGAGQVPTLPPLVPGESPSPSPTPSPTPSDRPSSPEPEPEPSDSTSGESSTAPASSGRAPTDPAAGGIAELVPPMVSVSRTTARLLELLEELDSGEASSSPAATARRFGSFPVAGYAWYTRDFGAPRYVPYYHPHDGTDLFAEAGTPVIASTDGRIARMGSFSVSGNAIWLERDDGTYFFYGHLEGFALGLGEGATVARGDIIGYVGDTGNAKGTYPHVHFEIHPRGGPAVDPWPILDRWLDDAEAAALRHIRVRAEQAALEGAGGPRWRVLTELMRGSAAPLIPLWPMAVDPAGASYGLADLALASLASRAHGGIDALPLEHTDVEPPPDPWEHTSIAGDVGVVSARGDGGPWDELAGT